VRYLISHCDDLHLKTEMFGEPPRATIVHGRMVCDYMYIHTTTNAAKFRGTAVLCRRGRKPAAAAATAHAKRVGGCRRRGCARGGEDVMMGWMKAANDDERPSAEYVGGIRFWKKTELLL
jgi:hypothetical protein